MTGPELEQLRRLFEVMERLRAPGGCPWDRAQTHASLVPYLLEETYEAIQAIEEGDARELAEELGDLLVEVAMHCAIAAESGSFEIGSVARAATEKMIGRHPHVFGGVEVAGVDQVIQNWESLKRIEKPDRGSALDGIPRSLPALALAASIQRRQERANPGLGGESPDPRRVALDAIRELARPVPGEAAPAVLEELVGELLFAVVALARQCGVDPEGALRRTAAARRQRYRELELGERKAPLEDPLPEIAAQES